VHAGLQYSPRVSVMISATLVNTQTHSVSPSDTYTELLTGYTIISVSWAKIDWLSSTWCGSSWLYTIHADLS